MSRRGVRAILVSLAMVVGLLSPVSSVVSASPAQAAPLCTNDDKWSIPSGTRGAKRCVNGYMTSTRARIVDAPGCLRDRYLGSSDLYTKNHCGQNGKSTNGGIEYIAQARAIAYLNEKINGPGADGIDPDIQWEVSVVKRPDIIYYDHTLLPSQQPFVQVIEAKQEENYTPAVWRDQIARQIRLLETRAGMTNVGLGTVYRDYTDVFHVNWGCPARHRGYLLRTYTVISPRDGLLLIHRPTETNTCTKVSDDDPDPLPEPLPEPYPVPDPAPIMVPKPGPWPQPVPDPLPVPGSDWIINRLTEIGQDTLVELLAQLVGASISSQEFLPWLASLRGGVVWGDPHLVTLDQLGYDMQSAGEFVLARSDTDDLEIQARFVKRPGDISVIDRVTMFVDEHVVELGDDLLIDGSPYDLASGQAVRFGEDTALLRNGVGYYVFWGGLEGGILRWPGSCCRASLAFAGPPPPDLIGLLGNADGDPRNDLKLADGTQLPADASPSVIHGDFADSWRISEDESMFTYAEGESTATYTDLSYPSRVVTVHDLAPEETAIATASCQDQDVPAGPQFNACILDLALTADADFADMAAQQKTTVLDPSAATVDEFGSLAFDFEAATIPQNLRPSRLSDDAATTAFAGPYTGDDSYRFFVQSLPDHAGGTLAFDLLAVGDWASDSDVETIVVRTDRATPVTITPSELTPTGTGTLTGGKPFTRYRVSVPFDHTRSQVEFTFGATGVASLSDQGFGIDNIRLATPPVPPQGFTVSLPFSVSDGTPEEGAGNLETAVSVDQYQFAMPADGSIYMHVKSCPRTLYLGWSLLNQNGTRIASGYCADKEVRSLPAGDYRLIVQPLLEEIGTYALEVLPIPADVGPQTLTVGGPETEVTTTAPGQNGSWTFTGQQGQRIHLGLSGGNFASTLGASVWVRKPDGMALTSTKYCGGNCFFDTTLPADGSYTIVFDPQKRYFGSLSAKVTEILADSTATLSADGPAIPLATTTPGQNGSWTFTGTAGQRLFLTFDGGTFGSNTRATVSVHRPDGSVLLDHRYCGTTCYLDTVTLPANGNYTIAFDPRDNHTGALSAKLSTVPPDPSLTLSVSGAAIRLTTTVPGQDGSWTFTGAQGQRVAFSFTDGTFSGFTRAKVAVWKPDGTLLHTEQSCGTSCLYDTTVLPSDGAYKITLDPVEDAVGALSARVIDVENDITAVAPLDEATSLTTTISGQNGSWTFSGTLGRRLFFKFSNGTFGTTGARVSILSPNGSTFKSAQFCGASCVFDTTALPMDGTYTIILDPQYQYIGSLTLRITEVPSDVAVSVAVGGDPVTLATVPGQNGSWMFSSVTGQRYFFNFSGGTFGTTGARVSILDPSGSTFKGAQFCGASCVFDTTALPVDGVYTVVLDPQYHYAGSLTLRITAIPADVTSELSINGGALPVTTIAPGQNAKFTFMATVDQIVTVKLTGNPYGYTTFTIRWPDGTTLASAKTSSSTVTFANLTLLTEGTYTITVDPPGSSTGTINAAVTA